jgi:hypothetical protein
MHANLPGKSIVDAQTAPGTRSGSVPENNADRRRDLFTAHEKPADLDQYEIVQIDNTSRIRKSTRSLRVAQVIRRIQRKQAAVSLKVKTKLHHSKRIENFYK